MPFREVVQDSYLIFIANLILLTFITFNSTLSRQRRKVFFLSGIISLLMLISNAVVYTFEGNNSHMLLSSIFNAISYSISGPVVLPFILMTETIHKRTQRVLLALAAVNALLCFISIFNGCIFWYDESGVSHLGKLSPVPYYLSALYIALLLWTSLRKYRLGNRSESVFLTLLSIGIIAAVILNTVLGFRFLVSGMAVLSCIFYFLFYATQTLSRDALTNALNRHSFYKDIQNLQRRQMFVISLDLNGLKQLNDNYGHDAGDLALLSVSQTAWEILPSKCRFYRMGGDEFEILYPDSTEAQVQELCERFKQSVEHKGYSVAIGYDEFRKDRDFDEVFKNADAIMYADKAQMKQAMAVSD
ncbi:MAG: diguanylate cyclase [Oscillospiraceae bacterium]|nr:diguanylate cyclase [Oscillospiraceae bacterium]